MYMDADKMMRAVLSRDVDADGRFFYGVRSTGIYCRPSCPSRPPRPENVVFFHTAGEAEAQGFRPCKRCRPDLADYAPSKELAALAKAAIDADFDDREALRQRLGALGVTRRHLTGVFETAYGLSPEQYAAQVRLSRARALLDAGSRVTDAAFAVGMDSAAAFATFFKRETGMSPSDYAARQAALRPVGFYETPLGMIRVEEDSDGLTGLRFEEGATIAGNPPGRYLADAARQVSEYFAGSRRAFDLPLSPRGSEFQRAVWAALREIPYGETRSYQEIAAAVGNGRAARAVGMANNRNPIMILIPCHRVVGKDGRLVGYAGGIDRKRYLLELESGGGGKTAV